MQTELFSSEPATRDCEQFQLGNDSIRLWVHAIEPDHAGELMWALQEQIPWRQEYLWLGGQKRAVPRLQCWMGDADSEYGYSGMRLTPEPWHKLVSPIRHLVESLTGLGFNSVLLNLYRHGQDSVAWHADDEPELGPAPQIASISLGAEREFQIKPKTRGARCSHRFVLPAGSLLLMEKGMQDRWLHQLPKVKELNEARINLTFRRIVESNRKLNPGHG